MHDSRASTPRRRRAGVTAHRLTQGSRGPGTADATPRAHVRGPVPLIGPAFVAAIAYVDPGNFATNLAAGSTYGYMLVWVVVVANVMAMVIQYLSAKAGIATGASLPELCRRHFPRPVVRGLWGQAEVVAMATDLAEILGGALALKLLFGIPLVYGGLITGVVAFALLAFQGRGHRPFEVAIGGLLLVISLGFLYSLVTGGLDAGAMLTGTIPQLEGTDSLVLAAGMLGATVMPHAIYLHGALTEDRYVRDTEDQRRSLLRSQRVDVVSAMAIAGLVNLSMVVIAAQVLSGGPPVDTIEGAHAGIGASLGPAAALFFALALLASGFAASSVGTYSGQVIMEGFLRRRVPLFLRRLITLAPGLVVLAVGVDPTQALILSQVVLSFGIPFALIPLVLLTRRRDVMGSLVNRPITTAAAGAMAVVISLLNAVLIWLTVTN